MKRMGWEWICIMGLIIISMFIIYIFTIKEKLNKKYKIALIFLIFTISLIFSYLLVSSNNTEIINSDIAIFFTYYPNEKIDKCISNVKIKDVDVFFFDDRTEVRYYLKITEPSIVTGGCIQLPINEIISNGILSLDFNKENHESLKIDNVKVFLLDYGEQDLDSFEYGTPSESFIPKEIINEQDFREYKYYHLSSLQVKDRPEFYLILRLSSVYSITKFAKYNKTAIVRLTGNFATDSNFVRLNFPSNIRLTTFFPDGKICINPYEETMKSLIFSDQIGGFLGIVLLEILDIRLLITLTALSISILFIIINFLRNKE